MREILNLLIEGLCRLFSRNDRNNLRRMAFYGDKISPENEMLEKNDVNFTGTKFLGVLRNTTKRFRELLRATFRARTRIPNEQSPEQLANFSALFQPWF